MHRFFSIIFVFLCCIFCFLLWENWQFGALELDSIIFHVYLPLKDNPTDWLNLIWVPIVLTIGLSCWPIILKEYITNHPKKSFLMLFVFLMVNLFFAEKSLHILNYAKSHYTFSNFIEKNYVDPRKVKIEFPSKKKNLIVIQVESLESSLQNKANGGFFSINYIPNLTKLAKKNISFSHSALIEGATVLPGTSWTIAGLVAETAGLPLKVPYSEINNMDQYSSFLPGITSLGDILKENGYTNIFILGTDKKFAGQENYLKQHGNYLIFDKLDITPSKQFATDEEVLEFTKNKIHFFAHHKQPFHMLIQTFDTHFGNFINKNCSAPFEKNFQNAFFCTDSQLQNFIHWFQKTAIYDETILVIIGDHLCMGSTIANEITLANKNFPQTTRKVYNVFINSTTQPVKKNHRNFSTIDIFPTILASIGVKIQGNRLGLGTNLFSNEKTLLEHYGYDYVSQELPKKSEFYNSKLLYLQ